MELRDLRHLVDLYRGAAEGSRADREAEGLFVLALTERCQLGVQWQPNGEVLLFAAGGRVPLRAQATQPPAEEDDHQEDDDGDDGVATDEIVNLDPDEHG